MVTVFHKRICKSESILSQHANLQEKYDGYCFYHIK